MKPLESARPRHTSKIAKRQFLLTPVGIVLDTKVHSETLPNASLTHVDIYRRQSELNLVKKITCGKNNELPLDAYC